MIAKVPTHCPHCLCRPSNLDMHLRFQCSVLRPENSPTPTEELRAEQYIL